MSQGSGSDGPGGGGERERALVAVPGRERRSGRVVAVTGAYSYVGAELIRQLEDDSHYARVLACDIRKPVIGAAKKLSFHKTDLTLPTADADLADLFRRESVDTVVHAAFLSTPTHNSAWAHEVESIGTMHVINASGEAKVHKLVMLSSTLVYGAYPSNPNFLTEKHEPRGHPRSRFVNDKVEAEKQVRRFAEEHPEVTVTILRAATTLGPTIRNFATRFFGRPLAPVLMGFDPLMQFVHESDLVEAFKLAVDADHPGIYNVVGDGVLPYTTILAMMGKIPVPMPRFIAYPISQAMWVTQVFDSPPNFLDFLRFLCVADGAKARSQLGFAPRFDIKATVQDFLGVGEAPSSAAGVR